MAEDWDVPLPIEGLAPVPEKKKAKVRPKAQVEAEAAKIVYRRFRSPVRTLCQDCVDESEAARRADPSKPVKFCHQVAYTRSQGEVTRLLCFQHTQRWRDKDGLEAFRAGSG